MPLTAFAQEEQTTKGGQVTIEDIEREFPDPEPDKATDTPPWSRAVPAMPQSFDWIKLSSDELLKGDFIALYDHMVEFDSDELGMLKLDWEDIVEVRTSKVMSLRFESGAVFDGKVFVLNDDIQLVGSETEILDRDLLISIAPSTKSDSGLWDGKVTVGFNVRSGNTDRLDSTIIADARRLTATNRVLMNYIGKFAEVDNEETENSHRFTGSTDWFYSQRIFIRLVDFEYFRDKFQNIADRYTAGVAAGYQIYNQSNLEWDVTAGPSFQYTEFVDVEEGESGSASSPVLQLGTMFSIDITKDIDYKLNYQVKFVSEEAGQYIHHLDTGIGIDLFNDFSLDLTVIVDRIEKPTPDSDGVVPKQDDIVFTVGLEYEF